MATLLPFPSFLLFPRPDDRQWRHLRAISLTINCAAGRRGAGRVYDSPKPCCMTHNIAIGKTSSLLSPSLSLPPLSKPFISRRRMACNYFYDFIQRQLTLQFVSGSVRPHRTEPRGLPFDAPFPSVGRRRFLRLKGYAAAAQQLVILLSNCYETTDGPSLSSLSSFARG